jgi:hypothetical protein
MAKSQSAIEFLSIIALGLILLIMTSYVGYNYVTNYFLDTNSLNARQTVSVVSSAANLIYSQGINASTKVLINVPYDVDRNHTYIYGKEINLRFSDPPRDATGYASYNLTGTIPMKPGPNVLYLKMTPDGVKMKVDDDIAFIGVKTYNDTARQNEDSYFNATKSETVYYQAKLEYFNGTPVNSALDINYYFPNATLYSAASGSTTNGVYNGTIAPTAVKGFWLISVYIASEKILGTALFNVTT